MFKRYKPFFRAGAMDMMAFKFNLFTWLIVTVFEVAVIVVSPLPSNKILPSKILATFSSEEDQTTKLFPCVPS